MAAKKRRKSPTQRQKNRKQRGFFNHILGCAAFLALGYAAVAGWWPDLMEKKTFTQTAHIIPPLSVPPQPRQPPQTSRAVQSARPSREGNQAQNNDEIRDLITVGSVTVPALIPPVVSKPQQKPLTSTHANTTLLPVPYKEDKELPPEGQFGTDNAAARVFAKDMVTVFAEKNKESKIIATLGRGQEMRLYETDANWQRIVVPSSDIIGWVTENSVTTTKPSAPF